MKMAKGKKKKEEPRDALGFTITDYMRMQAEADRRAARAWQEFVPMVDGWELSEELREQINDVHARYHYAAVICFIESNRNHLAAIAANFILKRYNTFDFGAIGCYPDEYIDSLFIDLMCGYLQLPAEKIGKAIAKSYRYMEVGGLEGVELKKEEAENWTPPKPYDAAEAIRYEQARRIKDNKAHYIGG